MVVLYGNAFALLCFMSYSLLTSQAVRSQILWLPTQPFVLTTTVYTFLRLIVDHTSNQVTF